MRSEVCKIDFCFSKARGDKIFPTGEFHSLAVDDEVGQLLGDLSTLLLVLRKVKLLTQLHVKNLQVQEEREKNQVVLFCFWKTLAFQAR